MSTYDWQAAAEATDGSDPLAPILGKQAVYTTHDGQRLVGTIEAPTAFSSGYPVIRFADGLWGRCDNLIELV